MILSTETANKNRKLLALVPSNRVFIFPNDMAQFTIREPHISEIISESVYKNYEVFVCLSKGEADFESLDVSDFHEIGVVAEIVQAITLGDDSVRILLRGSDRARLLSVSRDSAMFYNAEVEIIEPELDYDEETNLEICAYFNKIKYALEETYALSEGMQQNRVAALLNNDSALELTDCLSGFLSIKAEEKQALLEELDLRKRIEVVYNHLLEHNAIAKIGHDIDNRTEAIINRGQREYIVRQKIAALNDELAELTGRRSSDPAYDLDIPDEPESFEEQIEKRDLPEAVLKKLEAELCRLDSQQRFSQEYAVIENYIEEVLALPWEFSDEENLDTQKAKEILDRDHYGLEKVKERIIEYISVKRLTNETGGSILCLVGPPGTGKTSVVRSLAESLGRKYVRISLGGVQNESDIRGHRKTYVGSMPGRIMEALKNAGSNNPIILLDEIDKLGVSHAGDPASALLEVLDPEQNKSFRDHYIEIPFDLSKVMFIASANTLDTVPRPLIDRMDVIEVSGYTMEEKLKIANKYLYPKQRKKHGLSAKQLKVSDSAINEIIDNYTRESGVRNLERALAAISRKTAKKIVDEGVESIRVNKTNVSEFLGKPKYPRQRRDRIDRIGIVNGLAWTQSGGEILNVEVCVMEGNGKLILTGNLGDVMKESASAAMSYIRANRERLGLEKDFHKNVDVHIHFPEGAVPKDGPSAGVTMVTALVSALTKTPVRSDVAMTGEISLTGRVLAIGGLKEKTLAAYRSGIKEVSIPYDNKPDYDELPDIVKDNISFTFAKDVRTVLDLALVKNKKEGKSVAPKRRGKIESASKQSISAGA